MKPSQWVYDTIKRFEGLRLKPYRCPAGKWTVGYGHTRRVDPWQVITGDKANELLQEDIEVSVAIVNNVVTVDITQGQFDACVDFVFNLGCENFHESTLLKLINSKLFRSASDEFLKWNHCAGMVLDGLTIRREEEKERFLMTED